MSEQPHKAFKTLHGHEVNGYTVEILEYGNWGVSAQLVRPSRTPIAFRVEAAEYKFEMPSVLNDLRLELTKLTKEAEFGPRGEHSATFPY